MPISRTNFLPGRTRESLPDTQTPIAVVGCGLIGRKHVDIASKLARLDAVIDPAPAAQEIAALLLEFEGAALGTVSISDTVVAPWFWELTAGENPSYPKTSISCYAIGGTEASLSVPDLHLWRHLGVRS